jgi:hypothetical protein
MTAHIAETDGARLPWFWVMDVLLSELAARRFEFPRCWDTVQTDEGKIMALFVRQSHVMDHIASAPPLRQKFDALPIKTAWILKKQLLQSGVVPKHAGKLLDDVEKRIHGRRHAHMTAIRVPSLERIGLEAIPELEDARMPP